MLKCTSLEIFRPKITLKEAQIKRVKSPGIIIYSVSLGREGDPNCCAQELAIRAGEYFNVQHPRARVIYNYNQISLLWWMFWVVPLPSVWKLKSIVKHCSWTLKRHFILCNEGNFGAGNVVWKLYDETLSANEVVSTEPSNQSSIFRNDLNQSIICMKEEKQ